MIIKVRRFSKSNVEFDLAVFCKDIVEIKCSLKFLNNL